jgi:TPP-dependent pyruvate/acetoin dehydrogenase alpha subunit
MAILTKKQLIEFENEIVTLFNAGQIKSPIHLYSNNEDQMIQIFKHIKKDDWVFCNWRSHYQCLLKGIDPKILKNDILAGKSISLCYPEHKIYSSAIVAGNIPIAVGVALDEKLKGTNNHVWCFVGDMTAETGVFNENHKYAVNHDLPITFIIEDNGKSVCTDTRMVWNKRVHTYYSNYEHEVNKIIYYQYENKYPHAGTGVRIQF